MKNKITASFVVIILVISAFAIYLVFPYEEEKEESKLDEEIIIDDRISPLENQGLFVELNRIRHRGVLDKLITPGSTSWRSKPNFYAVVSSEGIEYSTKNIAALGAASENYFNTWDTMFMEQKNQFNPDEEQDRSTVEITIYENIPDGLLGLKNKDVEREKIRLTYDYRTGRWTGDDYFMDSDGYGHYLGDTFEVWFHLHQIDYDKDNIPYWVEVNVLGTNPTVDDSKKDPDNDGIPTDWEWYWGYDPFVWDDHENLDPDIDGIENIEEYQIRNWFANPFHQEIYCEIDNMKGKVLFMDRHMMWEESMQSVIERFAQHNINLYLDQGWPDTPYNGGGSLLPFYQTTSQDSGILLQFYNHYFPDERKGIFHYVVIGNEGGFTHPTDHNTYYTSHVYVNNPMFLLPFKTPIMVPTPRAWRVHVAAIFMHELGHSIGLTPWTVEGCDNHTSFAMFFTKEWRQYKESWGNYYSVMNYFWAVMNDLRKELIDYSDGSNAGTGYDVNDWETLYLPSFQTVSACNEDITAMPPCYDLCEYEISARERLNYSLDGWVYQDELTNEYMQKIGSWSPIDPVEVTFRVYKKTDETDENKYNIRVYGFANVFPTDSEYVLIEEGNIDSKENLQFYSQEELVEGTMELIKAN